MHNKGCELNTLVVHVMCVSIPELTPLTEDDDGLITRVSLYVGDDMMAIID